MEKFLVAGPGLTIGIPTLGRPVPLQWAFAFKSMTPPINYNMNVHVIQNKPVAEAREEIAEQAIKAKSKYLFFLGDDVVCPAHTLRQLIYRMENKPDLGVVGGVYCAKSDPSYPLVFRGNGIGSYWNWKIGEFFPVSGMGMDCTLIRTEILEKLSKPWFKTISDDQYMDAIPKSDEWTEDLYFFNKMEKETPDIGVYIDATVICEHWDVYGNRYYSLPLDSLPMRRCAVGREKKRLILGQEKVEADPKIADVTFGPFEGADYRGDYTSLPFDINEFDLVYTGSDVPELDLIDEEVARVTKKAA